jgi:hypothetical protein
MTAEMMRSSFRTASNDPDCPRINFIASPHHDFKRETLVQFSPDFGFDLDAIDASRLYCPPLYPGSKVKILAMAEMYDRDSSYMQYHFLVLRLREHRQSYERRGRLNLDEAMAFDGDHSHWVLGNL